MEMGHASVQPYLYWFQYRGAYDSDWDFRSDKIFNTFLFQPYARVGLFPRCEIDFSPQVYYNHVDGAAKWVFGDTPVWFVFMLHEQTDWTPSFLLEVLATLPTGKYQRFHPRKLETDEGGTGSWFPGAGLTVYRDFHLWGSHYLSLTGYAAYFFGTRVHVKGINYYGGDETTEGTVHRGNQFYATFSFELSLTDKWNLAMDAIYQHDDSSRFSGATEEAVGSPSSEVFSLAPAIEYLWGEDYGIVGGAWFTVGGRNTDQFNAITISFYTYL